MLGCKDNKTICKDMLDRTFVTQYNKGYYLSTFEKIEIFALSYRRFNKLSSDTKFIKIEVILLKIQVFQSVNFLLFPLYFTHCSLSQNKPGRQDVPFVELGHICLKLMKNIEICKDILDRTFA